MKRLLLIVLPLLLIVGCSESKDNSKKTIQDLVEYFDSNGIKGQKSETMYKIIGAIDGTKLKGAGYSMELYKFDGEIPANPLFNYKNGSFVCYINPETTSSDIKDKILKLFDKF